VSAGICDRLDDYLGGWLDEPEKTEFDAHLQRCAECRAQLETQRQLDALLRRARSDLEPVPPALVNRIEQRLTMLHQRRITWIGTGLAAAAVLVMSVLLLHDHPAWERTASAPSGLSGEVAATAGGSDVRPGGGRFEMQQLAMFVTTRCTNACPSAQRWGRMPSIPVPTWPTTRAFDTAKRDKPGEDEEEDESVNDEDEQPQVALSGARTNVSCIQSHRTLGARKLARIVIQ